MAAAKSLFDSFSLQRASRTKARSVSRMFMDCGRGVKEDANKWGRGVQFF